MVEPNQKSRLLPDELPEFIYLFFIFFKVLRIDPKNSSAVVEVLQITTKVSVM